MTEAEVQLVLAGMALCAFVVLALDRVRLSRRFTERDMGRLLLIDGLLLIAGVELVADAIHELNVGSPWEAATNVVAFACRGALVAGAIALVATINEAERTRRA